MIGGFNTRLTVEAGMNMSDEIALGWIGSAATAARPIPPDMRCEAADRIFAADPDLGSIAVVDGVRPVGLLNRYDMLTHLSRDFGRALYAKKPVTALMDPAPLIVAHDTDIEALESLIADQHPSALLRGYIVTRDQAYFGVGTALSLLQLSRLRTERRNRQLVIAREKAEAASRSKSSFLANMSHELRTPLNAILGFADLICRETYGPINNEKYAEYVCDMHASGQHLLELINNLLDMARIESGTWNIRPIIADPHEYAEAGLRQIRIVAAQKNITLRDRLHPDLFDGYFDPQALRHIINNLLSNAVKFTPEGGSVELGAVGQGDGGFSIWVQDTGIGIAPDKLAVALAPFGQVETELSRRHDGTGLGLPLVKALAELHGGRLELSSELGIFSTAAPPDAECQVTRRSVRLIRPPASSGGGRPANSRLEPASTRSMPWKASRA